MSSRRRPVSSKADAVDEPPSYRLRWSKRAEADLVGIDDYISADDPVAAARWIDKLTERARKAALLPYAGRVVPEFRMEALREVLVRAYRIVYRIRGNEVQVITVFEGHRLFPSDVDVDSDTE
jgi:plasmid stabilization system protein ParE